MAQDAFAKASFHWARIAAYDQPEAWVRRVAFNQAYNSTRRARRWLVAMARHGPPPDVPAASADRLDLHHALRRLSPRHREVLVLHYVAELPVEEVAAQLRLPVGTVKSRLNRARSALAGQLGDEREGSPMRDDLLKERLMHYARAAGDEAVQPDAAAIHRRARRHYRRLAALTVTAVVLVVGLGVGLGLRRGDGTPTVDQPPPMPTLTRPAPSTVTTGPPATSTTRAVAATGRLPVTFAGSLGGRVALVSTRTGKVVRALFGSQLPGSPGYAVGTTPDRSTVYFSVQGPEGCKQRGIFMVPSGGGQPVRVVADDNAGGQIKFSADGSRMAYTSVPCPDGGEGGDIMVRTADGALVRRWPTPPADTGMTAGQVSLSPDGGSVAVPVRLVLDAIGVRVLNVARTDAFNNGRLIQAPDPGCTLVAADFQPGTGRLAAFEGCRPGGPQGGSPSFFRLVYLARASGHLHSRSFSFNNTGGDLHISTMDFDARGRHLLYMVTSGTPVDGTGTWYSSRDGRPTRVPDDQQTSTGEPRTTQDPSW